MKIITVLGARPQFIKASVVSRAFEQLAGIEEIIVHTGQHFDANMSDVFFSELGIRTPRYQLDIHGGGHGEMTGRMLAEVEKVLLSEKPDAVLVYGDTNSTLAGALAAAKLHIPVAHVEAGLRSFNMAMPEEINRILTDRISDWLFTPTRAADDHLKHEGTPSEKILRVGDVMYDVALHFGRMAADENALAAFGLRAGDYVLTTVHRAENTDDPLRLKAIMEAFATVARSRPIIWPMHPRTRAILKKLGLDEASTANLKLVDPVGYLDMVRLEKYAGIIATDSGGVQKEAFFHKVPCVTLRDETEWTELVEAGWNRLVPPTDAAKISTAILEAFGKSGADATPYGSGDAAVRIAERLHRDLSA
ncbi:non-hydrolyzing UDP-N-acetylglucosamine 2-epimerase [Mesorhizobium sp. SP-1A]|uniref:non-hydrolyzing UDP-N-acetylglucosamine 2-epimerase n=1 Tax=Mesorhizobium sp. SP-1A TaxID=3077840 RepID=UPI0028F736BF|nr:UDP-N-acetylglucosamine 2-epimerase (non-hydrolyzing) [Mesorhizobium sp. SP-1A]